MNFTLGLSAIQSYLGELLGEIEMIKDHLYQFTFDFQSAMKFLIVLFLILEFSFALNYGQSCLDSNQNEGFYLSGRACKTLRETFGGEIDNYVSDQYDKRLKHKNSWTRICCAAKNITAVPSYFRELLKKLPQPPYCGQPKYETIQTGETSFGADPTGMYEYPWIVLLYYINTKRRAITKPLCSGSLISDRYVLTAAHCVVNTGKWNLTAVRTGEHDTENDIECDDIGACAVEITHRDFGIKEKIVHENYDRYTAHNDIALIRLSEKVHWSKTTKPVCLPWIQRDESSSYYSVGWGLSETGQWRTIKGRVDLPKVSQEECIRIIKDHNSTIVDTQICAGGEDGECVQILKEMSSVRYLQEKTLGGPLLMIERPNEIFGITSYGVRACGRPGIPSVYTRVDRFIEWILRNIKEEGADVKNPTKQNEYEKVFRLDKNLLTFKPLAPLARLFNFMILSLQRI